MAFEQLEKLLGKVSVKNFFANYFEQRPLVGEGDHSIHSFGIDDFESLLCVPGIRPLLRIVREQEEDTNMAAVSESGHLNFGYLFTKVSQGYTLVLNDIHRLNPELQRLAQQLSWELGCVCAINAYLTPPGTQALKPHFDSHDIFAVQCEGSKLWFVQSEGTELPTLSTHQPVLDDTIKGELSEVLMEPGAVMYLPRGSIHYAVAQESSSLHLTIGLYPFEWKDFASVLLEEIAKENRALRESVPLGQRRRQNAQMSTDQHMWINRLTKGHIDDDKIERAFQVLESRLQQRQPQPRTGTLRSIHASLELKDWSALDIWVKRADQDIKITQTDRGTRIELAGHGFSVPIVSAEMIRSLIADDRPFNLHERLPNVTNPVFQVVIELLLHKGVLLLVHAVPVADTCLGQP